LGRAELVFSAPKAGRANMPRQRIAAIRKGRSRFIAGVSFLFLMMEKGDLSWKKRKMAYSPKPS
jgi:hypothetical protein